MASRRLLLLSNSTNYGAGFLEHARITIRSFLGTNVREVLFVPFAAVRFSYDDFTAKVRDRFAESGYAVRGVHDTADPVKAVGNAEAIAVGGGNTFHLLQRLYDTGLLEPLRERALHGAPYIGWSAGSNIASPTIRTTNDMPIVEPPDFTALGLVPFQINPHYTDGVLPSHGGETRADRLLEFVEVNSNMPVIALREGSILRVEGNEVTLLGERPALIFVNGLEPYEVDPEVSLQFLMG